MKKKDIEKWRVLSSEYIFRKPWFTVRKEKVETPNGSIIQEYHVLEYPTWICVIAIDKSGNMILERQYRHGLGQVNYELCAGVVDDTDVNNMEAAKRELQEETGYGKGDWRELMQVCANPGTHTNMTCCFLATGVEKVSEPCLEATEDINVECMTREQVYGLLAEGAFVQAIHAAALWRFFAENPLERDK